MVIYGEEGIEEAIVSNVSPNCEKIALNKFNSSTVLSLAITQAI